MAPSGISTEKKKQRRKVILLFFLDCPSGCWVNVHSRWCWFLQWHQNQCSWKSNPYPEPTALQEPFRPLMPGLLGLLRHSASWAEQLPISQPFRYDGGLPSSGESRLKQSPKVTEKLPLWLLASDEIMQHSQIRLGPANCEINTNGKTVVSPLLKHRLTEETGGLPKAFFRKGKH